MKLKAQDDTVFFKRPIGTLNASKNRIHLKSNLELFRPQTSVDENICVLFTVFSGSTKIDEYSFYKGNLSSGERVSFYFDREYKYKDFNRQLSLGSRVLYRLDLIVTTTSANQDVFIEIDMGIGGVTYSLPVEHEQYKSAGTYKINVSYWVYMGNANTRDNGGKYKVASDGNATVVVNG